jgi:hypothetical protein
VLHQHLAEHHHREHGITLSMLTAVAPGDDVEVRRITVVNETDRPRLLSLTACAEVILATAADHDRHPAFNRLFVLSAHAPELDALVLTRRPEDRAPGLLHRVVCENPCLRLTGFETDRRAFLGRGGDPRRPAGLLAERLTGSMGWMLDAILAHQVEITLTAHGTCELAFVAVAAETRAAAEATARRYTTQATLDWAVNAALAQADLPTLQSLLSALVLPADGPDATRPGRATSGRSASRATPRSSRSVSATGGRRRCCRRCWPGTGCGGTAKRGSTWRCSTSRARAIWTRRGSGWSRCCARPARSNLWGIAAACTSSPTAPPTAAPPA